MGRVGIAGVMLLGAAALSACDPDPGGGLSLEPSTIPGDRAPHPVELCLPAGFPRTCVADSLVPWTQHVQWGFESLSEFGTRCIDTTVTAIGGPGHYTLPLTACGPDVALEFDIVAPEGTFAAEVTWSPRWVWDPEDSGTLNGRGLQLPILGPTDEAVVLMERDGEWVEIPRFGRTARWPWDAPEPSGRFRVELESPPRWLEFEIAAPTPPLEAVFYRRGMEDVELAVPVDDTLFDWTPRNATVTDGVLRFRPTSPSAADAPGAVAEWRGESPWGAVRGSGDFGLGLAQQRPIAPGEREAFASGPYLCPDRTERVVIQAADADWDEAPPVSSDWVTVEGVELLSSDAVAVTLTVPPTLDRPFGRLHVGKLSVLLTLGGHWQGRGWANSMGFEWLEDRTEPIAGDSGPPALSLPPGGPWWSQVSDDELRYGVQSPTRIPAPALLQRGCSVVTEAWSWSATQYSTDGEEFRATVPFNAGSEGFPEGIPSVALLKAPDWIDTIDIARDGGDFTFTVLADPGHLIEPAPTLIRLGDTIGEISFSGGFGTAPLDCDLPWIPADESGEWVVQGIPEGSSPDPSLDPRVLSVSSELWLATMQLDGPAGGGADPILLRGPDGAVVGVRSCQPSDFWTVGMSPRSIPRGEWSEVRVRLPADPPPGDELFVDGEAAEVYLVSRSSPTDVRLRVRPEPDASPQLNLRFASDGHWWGVSYRTDAWWAW